MPSVRYAQLMVPFASARGFSLVYFGVFALACTGIREDPTPTDRPPGGTNLPGQSNNTGGAGTGGGNVGGGANAGGSNAAGGDQGGAAQDLFFPDCACALITELSPPTACTDCVLIATDEPIDACSIKLAACDNDANCALARTVLTTATPCLDDPACLGSLLSNSYSVETLTLLTDYYACLCNGCSSCEADGSGGGKGAITFCNITPLP